MKTTARNVRKDDEVYSAEHGTWSKVYDADHLPQVTMVYLDGPSNGYPYAPNEVVQVRRRSWHQDMIHALLDHDETLDPYMEDNMIYVDFGHAAAVLIDFLGTGNGYVAVATAWAPDHGVDHEHVIVNGGLRESTAAAVADFLREQARRDDEIEAGR